MAEDTDPDDRSPLADDPTDSFDLECAQRVRVGVTRGEHDLEMGPPRDYPDRADVSVRPESDDGGRVVLSVDAMAGDHATGHADVELTPAEADALCERLEEILRWMPESASAGTGTDDEPDEPDGENDG
ncbi:hypothetical protein [Natrarchaeobius oligotrophus]|uniref:Uncharacterized protein n=1 Tax=Natrarchaeobius chitinivorans TaxID=1679083 RepID=A0A3N6PNZ3_NATCH|nr:hypothetical protein [Natrarchaeobius chitinivorans]RQH03450.1 hypothetical protein EA472_02525 [Natrarchaeobius chitinivorans]